MSSVHAVRAKKWKTNPFLAEWLANAAVYCQSKEGKKAFEGWLISEYGREKARQKLLDCQKPARKKYGTFTGNAGLFNDAAFELGVSDEAMQEYHRFTAGSNLCVPPRIKPAPRRRRGESSTEWLARRHDALLAGCKVPDIDWRIARALAVSEFDKARDTFEVWHADLRIFLEGIFKRSPTTLIYPEAVGRPEEPIYKMDYAFRASLHGVTLAYMAWGHAVDLFEELDRRGLTTTSAIERAYKQDSALMWRLVACLCKISYLDGHLWERFSEVLSWSEYYRPYFKRFRTPTGSSRIEVNRTYVRQRGGYETELDNVIIESLDTDSSSNPAFFDAVLKCLDKNPSEATKFSSEAYEEMGDIAIVREFKAQMFDSAFGGRLTEYAASKDGQCLKDPCFLPTSTFVDPTRIEWVERNSNDWAYARTISRSLGRTWLTQTNKTTMAGFFVYCIGVRDGTFDPMLFDIFDDAWRRVDVVLWESARSLDRRGEAGTVAKKFGLFDPADTDRHSCLETMLKLARSKMAERAAPPREPAAVPSGERAPSAAQEPAVAMSGHTYMAETNHLRTKEKVKTRGTAVTEDTAEADMAQEEDQESLPDLLPKDFKIGKKIMKVFHRILEAADLLEADEVPGAKRGQIRWAEFERAMKRIGFGVVQTAGSSVRFDPPAKKAHPITFHRPHPDSILTPNLLRWIGARLKRCYGWTTATFERVSEAEGED
ncbi:hypothetical protein B0H10DRAFT_2022400 [Mycena sp. CBHHK59/15]|nr:hypothetical protein B0H10DRAFT_2022400 [Mycena sp. CBHHK59/15]